MGNTVITPTEDNQDGTYSISEDTVLTATGQTINLGRELESGGASSGQEFSTVGQVFKVPPYATHLDTFALLLDSSEPTPVTLAVYKWDAGQRKIVGDAIYQSESQTTDAANGYHERFEFSPGIAVNPGQTYIAVIQSDAPIFVGAAGDWYDGVTALRTSGAPTSESDWSNAFPNIEGYSSDMAFDAQFSSRAVLANDTDANSDSPTAALVSGPSNGQLIFNSDGTFTYTPDANFHGTDSFTYKTNDGSVDSDVATINITVEPEPDGFVTRNGAEFQANTYTQSDQENPSVTALADGGFVLTWESIGQDGSDRGIYGQRYDADGAKVGDEFQVNTHTALNQGQSAVSALADGGFVVTWASEGQDRSGLGIYGQRYGADGNPVGSEFQVNTYTQSDQGSSDPYFEGSSVTGLADGGFVVTWQSEGQDGSGTGIYGQRFGVDAAKIGTEFQINTYSTDPQSQPSVTALVDGGFAVTWVSSGVGGVHRGIYGQRYDALGNAVKEEFQVAPGFQNSPSVAALADGGFVVAWEAFQGPYGTDIHAQRFDANGALVGERFPVNSNRLYRVSDQENPAVTALADGGFLVTWTTGPQDTDGISVFGQRYDAEGSPLGEEFQVNYFTTGVQSGPAITTLASGDVVVAWQSEGQDGSGNGVYAQRFTTPRVNLAPEATIDSYSTQEDAALVIAASEGLLANDTDANPDTLSAILVTGPASGSLTLNADGSFTYTPDADFNGSDSFTYKANDGEADSGAQTVTISIAPVNDAAVIGDPADAAVTEDESTTTLAATGTIAISDVDGASEAAFNTSVTGDTGNLGSLVLAAGGSYTYSVDNSLVQHLGVGEAKVDTFTVEALDGTTKQVSFTIHGTNDAPTLTADPITVSCYEDGSTTNLWNLIVGNGQDIEGDSLIISAIDSTSIIGHVAFSNGKLVYYADDDAQDVLEPGDVNTTTLTYTLSDGNGGTVLGTLDINVMGVLEPKRDGLYAGTSGNDVMQGSEFDDKINSGDGNDLIIGYLGNDIMNGGNGFDTVKLGANFGRDTLVDFTHGEDVIDARDFFGEGWSHQQVFNALDQNGDGSINIDDTNVSWGQGRLTIDCGGGNALILVGVEALTALDFGNLYA